MLILLPAFAFGRLWLTLRPLPSSPASFSMPALQMAVWSKSGRCRNVLQVLQIKVQKLEQLLQLKNAKIETLLGRMQAIGA